ncbi:MAG: metallophosphoesterase family protein [Myxococcota bacterium]
MERLEGRVGVIGDAHALDDRLERAVETLRAWGAQTLLQVGDIVDGPGDADRTVSLLEQADVVAIAGNHERWFLEGIGREKPDRTQNLNDAARAYLEALPTTRRFTTPLGGLLLCHGVGENDMDMLKSDTRGFALRAIEELWELIDDPDLQLMVAGHTHERMVRHFDGLTAINAGTLHDTGPGGIVGVDFDEAQLHCWDWSGDAFVVASPLRL